MNRYAAALGLADTHYANPIGLDQRGNYSSARDLATLTRRLLRDPGLRQDRRLAQRRAAQPPPAAADRDDQRAAADGALGDRGEDRPHLRRRLRPGRLRPAQGGRADLGRDRRPDRRSPLRRQPRPARIRLLASTAGGCRSTPARTSPTRRSATPAASCRCGPRARVAVGAAPRPAARASTSSAPAEVEGPIRRGAALGRATVLVDGRAGRRGAAARRPRDPEGERSSTAPAASSTNNPIPHRDRAVRDTDWRGTARRAVCPPKRRGADRVEPK